MNDEEDLDVPLPPRQLGELQYAAEISRLESKLEECKGMHRDAIYEIVRKDEIIAQLQTVIQLRNAQSGDV